MQKVIKINEECTMKAIIFIRCAVGLIFISEGMQKFLFPAKVGAGRFHQIGIPFPEFSAPFVGSFEIICGLLVIIGLLTRFAVIPLIVIILTAILSTKIPLLINTGFWNMAHEARTDFAMLLSLIFLCIAGSGTWSLDTFFKK
jgi:putative oxidoreductase